MRLFLHFFELILIFDLKSVIVYFTIRVILICKISINGQYKSRYHNNETPFVIIQDQLHIFALKSRVLN